MNPIATPANETPQNPQPNTGNLEEIKAALNDPNFIWEL